MSVKGKRIYVAEKNSVQRYWQDTVTICTLIGSVGLVSIILLFNEYSKTKSLAQPSNSSQQVSSQNSSSLEMSSQNTLTTSSSAAPLDKPQDSSLTQSQAVELVTQWLSAKPKIFGPPFDKNLLGRLTTGNTYQDNLGSIDWLQGNGYRYTYSVSRIDDVWSFVTSNTSPFIKVSVYEDLTLYSPRGIDRSKSGASKRNFIYYFAKDVDGQWKISDYRRSE